MKQLEKKDLIIGEIYSVVNQTNSLCVFKHKYTDNDVPAIEHYAFVSEDRNYFKKDNIHYVFKNLKLAIPEEKHWLNECIKLDKFITFEEAMKTFIPEYVECIRSSTNGFTENKIYKIEKNWNDSINFQLIDNNSSNRIVIMNGGLWRFKPSTKEAYDAQFVVKEPEFVLPKIWWVRITKENLKDISKFLDFNLGKYTIGFVAGMVKSGISGIVTKGYNSTPTTSYGSTFGNEITFEQFKKYVLKEDVEVLEEPKDKVLSSMRKEFKSIIYTVESSEGAIYQLGDKIKVFGGSKNSMLKNRNYLTIIGFRWNSNKTSICAITELYGTNGIGLDKIELYSEPKVEIVEDFVLPETWWITIENERQLEIAKQYFSQYFNNLNIFKIGKTVGYVKNVLDNYPANAFNLLTTTKQNNPQITFEQFEQYVLHNGFKVGDRFTKQKYCEVTEKEIIALEYIRNSSIAVYKYTSNNYTSPQCRILTKNIVR